MLHESRLIGYNLSDFQNPNYDPNAARASALNITPKITTVTPQTKAVNPPSITAEQYFSDPANKYALPNYVPPPTGPSLSPGQSWSGGVMRSDGTMAGGSNADPLTPDNGPGANERAYTSTLGGAAADPLILAQLRNQDLQAYALKQQQLRAEQEAAQKKAAASAASSAASTAAAAKATNPITGQVFTGPAAQRLQNRLDQNAIEHARSQGMSDEQIQQHIASGTLPPAPPNFDASSPTPTASSSKTAPGSTGTGGTTQKSSGTTPTQGNGTQAPIYTPEQSAQIIPWTNILNSPTSTDEQKMIASGVIQTLQTSFNNESLITQGLTAQTQTFADQRADLKLTISNLISQQKDAYDLSNQGAEEIRKMNEKSVTAAEQAAQARLKWETDKQTRQLTEAQTKAHDEAIAALAVTGRAGSSGALSILNGINHEYEQQLAEVQSEMGVQSTEISAKFTALHSQVYQSYYEATTQNMKDYVSNLQAIGLQGLSGRNAIATAENSALENFVTQITSSRNTAAANLQSGIKEMAQMVHDDKRQKAADDRADARMKAQEELANRRFEAQQAAQDKRDANNQKKIETASADDIRSQIRNAMGDQTVKDYMTLKSDTDKIHAILEAAVSGQSTDPNAIGAAKELAITLVAKASDPTTGVREGEITKFGKNQTWVQNVMAVNRAIFGGDMTGISMEAVKSYEEMIGEMTKAQKQSALSVMTPAINAVITHNNRAEYFPLNPADAIPPQFLDDATEAFNSYTNAEARLGEGYDFQWDTQSNAGSTLDTLASAHQQHEGFGTDAAKSITANNNPGALRWSDAQTAFGGVPPGAVKPDGTTNDTGFTWFPDYKSGRQALISDISSKIKGNSSAMKSYLDKHGMEYKDATLYDYIAVYAPTEDGNDPSSYAQTIAKSLKKTGLDVNMYTKLSDLASLIS